MNSIYQSEERQLEVQSNHKLPFDLIGKLFQPYVYERIIKGLRHKDVGYPIVIELDPTTNCNQKCQGCISNTFLNTGEIPLPQLQKLFDIFVEIGIMALILTGGGEPLLHTEISKVILSARKRELKLGLITNGKLLEKYAQTFDGSLSWLRVSVDAAKPEIYSALHYGGSKTYSDIFSNVIKGMKSFVKCKNETILGYSFLVHSGASMPDGFSNIVDIYDACRLAKDIGCDYFEIKPRMDHRHFLCAYSDEELLMMKDYYYACKELDDNVFRVYCAESLQDFLFKDMQFNEQCVSQRKLYTKCLVSKFRTTITKDGIYPCPYLRGNMLKGYAFAFNEHFLNAIDFQQMFGIVSQCVNPSEDCEWYCIRHKQNLFLHSLDHNLQAQSMLISNEAGFCDYDPFI